MVEREAGGCQYRERSGPPEPGLARGARGSDRVQLDLVWCALGVGVAFALARSLVAQQLPSPHPFHPLRARCRSREWIGEVLCFPRDLVVFELHDAHRV